MQRYAKVSKDASLVNFCLFFNGDPRCQRAHDRCIFCTRRQLFPFWKEVSGAAVIKCHGCSRRAPPPLVFIPPTAGLPILFS